jgi:tetratricopeptide (TPR) repeat protein
MSTEQIKQLHEQASERYLSGDYQGAVQAWRDVLGLDPENEQALGGMRLAAQFVEPGSQVLPQASPEVEHDVEEGLRVLDGIGVQTLLNPEEGDGAIDRPPRPEQVSASANEEFLEGWDTPAPSPDEGSFGLEPVPLSSTDPNAPLSAAAAELKRRVDDLLAEAKLKAAAGERDEALAILARLSILDEENVDAVALRATIEREGASDLDKVERAIIEGVAALEGDQLDDAERFFREALAIAPEHREAQHYLQKVTERRAASDEDLLSSIGAEAPPAEDAVQRATDAAAAAQKQAPALKPPRPAAPALPDLEPPPLAMSGPRFVLTPMKVLVFGGAGALLLVCAAIALPHLFGGSRPMTLAPKASAPPTRPARTPQSGPGAKPAVAAPARVATVDPEVRARGIASGLATGQSLMTSSDFGGAVVAFNQVLALDPENAMAKAGIAEAGVHYKASKAERDAISNIRFAFRDGEFTSGLRLAYRLPPSVSTSFTDGVKVAGWYNLAVVALRAGDCRGALSNLDEALEIAPLDAEAKQLREFASRYAELVKDREFLDRVEALAFRPLPAS